MILAAFLFLKRMSDVATVRQWVDKDNLDNEEISEDIDLKHVPKHTAVYEIFGSLFLALQMNFLISHMRKEKES